MATTPKKSEEETCFHDLRAVIEFINWLERWDPEGDHYVYGAEMTLANKQGYSIGKITYHDDQWWFTARYEEH